MAEGAEPNSGHTLGQVRRPWHLLLGGAGIRGLLGSCRSNTSPPMNSAPVLNKGCLNNHKQSSASMLPYVHVAWYAQAQQS